MQNLSDFDLLLIMYLPIYLPIREELRCMPSSFRANLHAGYRQYTSTSLSQSEAGGFTQEPFVSERESALTGLDKIKNKK